MGRLPKEKVTLSVYVSPESKKMLECLQQLYFIAGKRFSLSEIVEESIRQIYGAAYCGLKDKFWIWFFKATNFLESNESSKEGINDALSIIEEKPAAAKEIMTVPVNLKENALREIKATINKVFKRK